MKKCDCEIIWSLEEQVGYLTEYATIYYAYANCYFGWVNGNPYFICRNSDRDPYFDHIEDMEEFYLNETTNDGSGSSLSGSSSSCSRSRSMPDDDGSLSDQRD